MVVLLAAALCACASARQEMSALPEQYGGLDPWISGEIVEVANAGGRLRLASPRSYETRRPRRGATDGLVGEPPSIWVELRYAKGWVYFDALKGGGQERTTLREGRERFAIGQWIAIGRSIGRRCGYDHQAVQASAPSGTHVGGTGLRFHGWIMLRVTESDTDAR